MTFDIFPAGGLASSVITAVWVGVFVVVILNLRFGTTLSGLVIPGYLVPLLFIKPLSAGVVIIEGITTYFVTLALAKFAMKQFGYSELFGRDRFFALVVVSVLVRILFDHWALPHVGGWAVEQGLQFDYQNHLQSFGLIIVSLIANQFWNSGFKSGSKVLVVYIGLTYLIIKFLLVPFTNFNIAEIGYMYENLAQSLLASPKAYIILITTAFIASRMNLFYGWEFNGILIPSLLALQWYQPEKLLFTFIETIIILLLGHAVTRLSVFKNISFEGSRLFLLFFNISFIYKIVLGFFLIEYFPTTKLTDFYGFGYLISTLLAIKMYQKDIAVHMTRATLQTSFIAVLLASIIGFTLTFIPSLGSKIEVEQAPTVLNSSAQDLQKFYTDYRPTLFQAQISTYSPPTVSDLEIFEEALSLIKQYKKDNIEYNQTNANALLSKIHFQLELIEDKYLVISDTLPQRGWGFYVINLTSNNNFLLQAPDSLTEKYTDIAALKVFEHFQANTIAISTSKRKRASNGMSDVLAYPATFYHSFYNAFANNNVLQFRGYTQELTRKITGQRTRSLDNKQQNIMWIKKQLPADLPLRELEQWLKQLDVRFTPAPFDNIQRDSSAYGFAEILLTSNAIKRLLADVIPSNEIKEITKDQKFTGYLQSWLRDNKSVIAKKGSNAYQVTQLSELLFWDEEIIKPLLTLAQNYHLNQWSEFNLTELNRLATIASAYNYNVTRYIEKDQQQEYLKLSEVPSDNMRHWGTLIIRLGEANDYLLEVPNPLFEISTFEFATAWFSQLNARYLLLSGSHPYANALEQANVAKRMNKGTVFQLIHQSIQQFEQNTALLPVQIRSLSAKPGQPYPKEDVQLSFWQSIGIPNYPTSAQQLNQSLKDAGLSIALFDGSLETSSYDAGYSQQASYSKISQSGGFATIRLSPQLQYRYKEKSVNSIVAKHMRAMKVTTQSVDLKQWLPKQEASKKALSDQTLFLLEQYQQSLNVLQIQRLIKSKSEKQFEFLYDIDSGQEFILLKDEEGNWQTLFNPYAIGAQTLEMNSSNTLIQFINQRDSILLAGDL